MMMMVDGNGDAVVELPAADASVEVGSSASDGKHCRPQDCRADSTDRQLHRRTDCRGMSLTMSPRYSLVSRVSPLLARVACLSASKIKEGK